MLCTILTGNNTKNGKFYICGRKLRMIDNTIEPTFSTNIGTHTSEPGSLVRRFMELHHLNTIGDIQASIRESKVQVGIALYTKFKLVLKSKQVQRPN